jgi:hypothetical protein
MHDDFLTRYFAAFADIPGWFSPEAGLLFMAYHQLLTEAGVEGDVLEIGVHHGLSAIGLAAMIAPGRRFFAVDLFDGLQAENVSHSGLGNRAQFLANMGRFHDDLSPLVTIAAPSASLRPSDLGREFTFCHIDGGHSMEEAFADLELAAAISKPGGLVGLDDYFNPAFPGVGEAAVRFHLQHGDAFQPVAIGFNKAIFQRRPAPFDLNRRFHERFPEVVSGSATLWGVRVPMFDAAFRAFFDLERSGPRRLAVADGRTVAARIETSHGDATARAGGALTVPVQVTNLSRLPLSRGSAPFGLSYHVWSADRRWLRFDNPRTWFEEPLLPGDGRTFDVEVQVPETPGTYEIEFDIVWEGVLWLKDHGNPTARIALEAVGTPAPTSAPSATL